MKWRLLLATMCAAACITATTAHAASRIFVIGQKQQQVVVTFADNGDVSMKEKRAAQMKKIEYITADVSVKPLIVRNSLYFVTAAGQIARLDNQKRIWTSNFSFNDITQIVEINSRLFFVASGEIYELKANGYDEVRK